MKTFEQVKPKKQTSAELLFERLDELNRISKLDSWNSFVEELKVPYEIYPALTTGRAQLIKVAPARELSKDECQALYTLIGALIDTNTALREHAAEVAHLVDIWSQSFKQLGSLGHRIQLYANFRKPNPEGDEE